MPIVRERIWSIMTTTLISGQSAKLQQSANAPAAYQIELICGLADELAMVKRLLTALTHHGVPVFQLAIRRSGAPGRVKITAVVKTYCRRDDDVNQLAIQLTMVPGIISVCWNLSSPPTNQAA